MFMALGLLFNFNTLYIGYANEVENAKLSSNISTYLSGDKSEEEVVFAVAERLQ